MRYTFLLLALLSVAVVQVARAQEETFSCQILDTTPQSIQPLVNTTLPVVLILVDYSDSRKPDGSLPTVDADTIYFPGSAINAVAGMGWVPDTTQPGNLRKKIRKYTYEDYWNMHFSDSIYYDDGNVHPHPDWDVHGDAVKVYGSIRDYYREVSYGNLILKPESTWAGPQDTYHTGIVNRIDEANGRKYVRWIKLPNPKSYYSGSGRFTVHTHARNAVIALHQLPDTHPDYIEFDITSFTGKIITFGAGAFVGGYAFLNSQHATGAEKGYFFQNEDQGSRFAPILNNVHELGHTLGLPHHTVGSFDPMHCGGFAYIMHWCPPHFNPMAKINFGWIDSESIAKVKTSSVLSLKPSHLPPDTAQPTVALITVYGEAGRDNRYDHSEFFVLEYRKREGFNRFSGGATLPPGSQFTGGALVWHYSTLTPNWHDPGCGGSMTQNLGLKIPGYGPGYSGDQQTTDYLIPASVFDSSTTPNSNSVANLITGIRLSHFETGTNVIEFSLDYHLGEPPDYDVFLYRTSPIPTLWSGNIYNQMELIAQVQEILPGSVTETITNGRIAGYDFRAIGTSGEPITFRGIGYGSHRMRWFDLLLQTNSENQIPEVRQCHIKNAIRGVALIGSGSFPSPIVRSSSFEDCLTDIWIIGQTGANAFELAGLDSNNFVKMELLRNAKVSLADFTLAPTSSLYLGTPGYQTTITVLQNKTFVINGSLVFNTNATIAGATWRFGSSVTVPSEKALTISPASSVSFDVGKSLVVNGVLNIEGASGQPIIFTRSGPSGTWNGIAITGGTSTISYADISHCGTAVHVSGNSAVTMEHCTVTNASIGVEVYPPWVQPIYYHSVRNCSFDVTDVGVLVESFSDLLLEGNVFSPSTETQFGVICIDASPTLLNNTIENFTFGLAALGASSPILQNGAVGGCNIVTGNQVGVSCQEGSSPVLGFIIEQADEGGLNSIYRNHRFDVESYTSEPILAQNDYWTYPEDPLAGFYDEGGTIDYAPWLTEPPDCGASKVFAGKGGTNIEEPLSNRENPLLTQAMRHRSKREYAQATGVLKAMIANEELPMHVRRWSVHQLLAVSQKMRNPNLSGYLTAALTRHPELAREMRRIMPGTYLHEGNVAAAMAAYDANMQLYPNSSLERSGLYAKFLHALHRIRDGQTASALYQELAAKYPGSTEQGIAAVQLSNAAPGTSPSQTGSAGSGAVATTTTVPTQFSLAQNYPNPFNPATIIQYSIPAEGRVVLKLYSILGSEVAILVDEVKSEGRYDVRVDASGLSSGVYLYKLQAAGQTATRKMLVLK